MEFVFPKFNISLPVLINLLKLPTTPYRQSSEWSINGHKEKQQYQLQQVQLLIESL